MAIAASFVLGVAIASPFWWALLVRLVRPALGVAGPDPSVASLVELWPAILTVSGAAWGGVVGYDLRRRWSAVVSGAIAGAAGNGAFALAIVMGPAHEALAASLPGALAERFVLLLPILVGLVAGGNAFALALAVGAPRRAVRALLVGAAGALLSAFVIVALAYAIGVRVGSGDAVMARMTAPALTAAALVAGSLIAWTLRQGVEPRDERFTRAERVHQP
jgi:hypothetical protein